jgi:hypothetical protein
MSPTSSKSKDEPSIKPDWGRWQVGTNRLTEILDCLGKRRDKEDSRSFRVGSLLGPTGSHMQPSEPSSRVTRLDKWWMWFWHISDCNSWGIRDPMRWFSSIYLNIPPALGPGVHSGSDSNEYQKQKNNYVSGVKVRPVRMADNLTTICEPIV